MPSTVTTEKRHTVSDFAHDVLLAAVIVFAAVSLVLSLTVGFEQ